MEKPRTRGWHWGKPKRTTQKPTSSKATPERLQMIKAVKTAEQQPQEKIGECGARKSEHFGIIHHWSRSPVLRLAVNANVISEKIYRNVVVVS
jgi:hypothetical protein